MKILFIQPYISFSGVISDTLPGQLARKGHQIDVISYFRNKNKQNTLLEEQNIRLSLIDALSIAIPNFVTEYPYFLNLENVIKQIRPNIIHINNLPFLTTIQSINVAKKLGIPSVLHVHGVTANRSYFFNFFQWLYLRSVGKHIFCNTDKVICLTAQDAVQINSFGCPSNKIKVIPNGVDVNKFKPDDNKTNECLILWMGRFVHEKGLEYLVKAMVLVKKAQKTGGADARSQLMLIGDGPAKMNIKNLIHQLNLDDSVKVLPSIHHTDVANYLEQASIFVLPSLKEGMPLILLEAMACGKAVIGSDISGIRSVIKNGQNGILVSTKDVNGLANSILALTNNKKLRQELGKNARQTMIKSYEWKMTTERVEQVYSELMNEGSPNLEYRQTLQGPKIEILLS